MKVTGILRLPEFNRTGYLALLNETLSQAVSEAARIWLSATVTRIPVYSGASRATFVQLASLVDFNLQISPVARTRYSLGLNNGEGDVTADRTAGIYNFTYKTTLPHLIWNEFHNANIEPDDTLFDQLKNPGPYEFQLHGKDAFDSFAPSVRLPDPLAFLTSKERRIR